VEWSALKILRLDPTRPDSRILDLVVAELARGQLVVIPTETVYGLAADPRALGAVEKIYSAKERPGAKPVAFLAADLEQVLARGAVIEAPALRLIRRFWPGPMTLALKTPAGFVGFRVPDYPVALSLLWKAGSALAVTSANRSGHKPALTAAEAVAALSRWVSLVLDAGTSPGGVPSTVVKVDGENVDILREGAIRRDEIFRVAGVNGHSS
jgi:tRNA threonylcarbamoyl adenosine modification protein (Sua5/YciO/YrdC/YwlC family)